MPTDRARKLKPPCFIQLRDVKELARLTCALERTPLPTFYIRSEERPIVAVQLDIFLGTPIFYYAYSDEKKHFLAYRNSGGIEESMFTDSPMNPTFAYSPIIDVKRLPKLFRRGLVEDEDDRKFDKFLSIETEDITSLAKLGSYKLVYEEPPFPLFLFSKDDASILGAFARIDDYEEASIFFYTVLDSPPSSSFLRFSPMKPEDTGFTNHIDEHGFVLLKIVRLQQKHPLVDVS